MYLVTLTLLVITLSVQVQVRAGPIPISAATDTPAKTEATFEAMDPTKMEVFERAEDATAKFFAKPALANDDDRATAPGSPKAWPVGTTFKAMDPAKMDVFEHAEDATAKFIAERATTTDDGGPGANTDDDAIDSASVTDGDGNSAATENHEGGASIRPIPPLTKPRCSDDCPEIWQPLCAHNKLGDKKTFGNRCKLNLWNCRHHFNAYVEDHKGECDAQ
ncbi:hypothetical protein BGZ47_009823 [Haplosporangium gracile]|nr:hypothetical protein BGZ47_009823 [Haplosporangium gracile]